MKKIEMPENYNYIAAFLTLDCNYRCSYCISYSGNSNFDKDCMSGEEWVKGLNRIISRENLPVTLQGGEPSIHKDFIFIINNINPNLKIDILTNLQFDVSNFIKQVNPERLRRDAPYASIRVSYHCEVMDLDETIDKVLKMMEAGFSIGIWGILHPLQKDVILAARDKCLKLGIDFRIKEFLGEHERRLYGTYKYEGACSKRFKKEVLCKTTELIIGPNGNIYRCHSDLYESRKHIGHILDPVFEIEDIFRKCDVFGYCNPCDIKIKTNRFQRFGHTSVTIKEISSNRCASSS